MNYGVRVRSGKATKRCKYDLVIGAIGYERRARHAMMELAPTSPMKYALQFEDRQEHDFKRNIAAFAKAGFQNIPADKETLRELIIGSPSNPSHESSVWVDISSLTRPLIATICYELFARAVASRSKIHTSFIYSHAKFSPPPPDSGPIVHKGAVIPEFAGWSDDPSTPCSAIFGIGYEVGLALGALEDLEPSEAWAFRPAGHARDFDREIDSNNADFLSEISPQNIINYGIESPLELVASLESLIYGRLQTQRVVVIPFGLKLFALAAFLVALQHLPRVTVWRVSGGNLVTPVNRIPSGKMSYLDVIFDGTVLCVADRIFSGYSHF